MIWAAVLIGGLFLGMLILLETGRKIGLYKFRKDPEGFQKGIGAVEGAVFGLLGFSAFPLINQLITEVITDLQADADGNHL